MLTPPNMEKTRLVGQSRLPPIKINVMETDSYYYRWPYPADKYRMALGQAQVVLQGMPGGGSHETRTLEFDTSNRVYVKYVL